MVERQPESILEFNTSETSRRRTKSDVGRTLRRNPEWRCEQRVASSVSTTLAYSFWQMLLRTKHKTTGFQACKRQLPRIQHVRSIWWLEQKFERNGDNYGRFVWWINRINSGRWFWRQRGQIDGRNYSFGKLIFFHPAYYMYVCRGDDSTDVLVVSVSICDEETTAAPTSCRRWSNRANLQSSVVDWWLQ